MSEFPWEVKKRKKKESHISNGYDVEMMHSGQKRAYGDTFREFTIKTEKPESEAEEYCCNEVYECSLPYSEWLAGVRRDGSTASEHFRSSYKFRKVKEGEYFYQVIQPSTH